MKSKESYSLTALADLQRDVAELKECLALLTDAVRQLAAAQGVDISKDPDCG